MILFVGGMTAHFRLDYGNRGISLRENPIGLRECGISLRESLIGLREQGYKPTGEPYRATGMVISLRGKVFP